MGVRDFGEKDPAARLLDVYFGEADPRDRMRIRDLAAAGLAAFDQDGPAAARPYEVAVHVLALRIASKMDNKDGFPGNARWERGEFLLSHPTDYDPLVVAEILAAEEERASLETDLDDVAAVF